MTWKTVQIGAMMTKNRDGTDKSKPTFWTPHKKPLLIPEGSQTHARPVLLMSSDEDAEALAISLYRDEIITVYRGKEYIMARAGQTPQVR